MILTFTEILWVLYYYNDFNVYMKANAFLIIFLFIFSFLFWLPFNYYVLNLAKIDVSVPQEEKVSYISSRLFFTFFTCSIILLGLLLSILIDVPDNQSSDQNLTQNDSQKTQTGYTSTVSILDSLSERSQGSSKNVLYFFLSEEQERAFELLFPGFLLKVDLLDYFDGEKWTSSQSEKAFSSSFPQVFTQTTKIDAIRVFADYKEIPHPYSTRFIQSDSGVILESNEKHDVWRTSLKNKYNTALQYYLTSTHTTTFKQRDNDIDRIKFLSIPSHINLNSNEIKKYRAHIFHSSLKNNKEKAYSLLNFLKDGNFKVKNYTHSSVNNEIGANSKNPQEVIESFLLKNKEGFCDIFSTAFALLLRAEGIPTRIISGFKLTSIPYSGVLSIKERDAHAWVEAWIDGEGWVVFDPTPSIKQPSDQWSDKIKSSFQNIKDFLTASILALDLRKPDFSTAYKVIFAAILKVLIVAFLLVGFFLTLYWILKRKKNELPYFRINKGLHSRREKIKKSLSESGFIWLKQNRKVIPIRGGRKEWMDAFDEWCLLDELLRFSADGIDQSKIKAHCDRMDELFLAYKDEWQSEVEGIKKRKSFHNDVNNIKKTV